MPENEAEQEIVLRNLGSDEQLALCEAISNQENDFGLRTDVTISRVTEDNVHDLLSAVSALEIEYRENGLYSQAEAAVAVYGVLDDSEISGGQ